MGIVGARVDPRPKTTVKVKNMQMEAVVDTGAVITILPEEVFPEVVAPVKTFMLADGESKMKARGPVPLQIASS